jgi:tetratricopeptide (TPR) repeat protein
MNARIASIAFTSLASVLLAGPAYADSAEVAAHAGAPVALVAAAFDRGMRIEPGIDAKAHVDQGFALIRRGKQAQAVKLFDKVIADADQRLAGDLRPRLCREAGIDASHAVEIDPAVCDAHFGKGFALIDLGRGDLAENELRAATRMAPGNAHFANEYAELFKARRAWPESYAEFAHAWAIVDKATDAKVAARALRGMGFTKAQMGQYDEAATLYQQSLQYDPASPIAQAELGNIARRKAIGS